MDVPGRAWARVATFGRATTIACLSHGARAATRAAIARRACLRVHWRAWTTWKVRAQLRCAFWGRAVDTAPLLPAHARDIGSTGYLDRFTPARVMQVARDGVAVGVDAWKRPFVCIAYERIGARGHPGGVCTVFQRYTDSPWTWAWGGAPPPTTRDNCSNRVDPDEFAIIVRATLEIMCDEHATARALRRTDIKHA